LGIAVSCIFSMWPSQIIFIYPLLI
jgi:hypothetical protein